MLKKFTTLLCVGLLSVAFVGCETADDGVIDRDVDVEGTIDNAGDAVENTGEAVEENVEAATDAE